MNTKHGFPIRAHYPSNYNSDTHTVTEFKMDNYSGVFERGDDGLYRYSLETAFDSYTEGALLALSNVTVLSFTEN